MMKIKARAKVNLFLEVARRRPDGYHNLATLFARVGLCDELEFKKTSVPGIELEVRGGPPGLAGGDNIVYKAAVEFFRVFGLAPAVKITLDKKVPVGAGLGGGSSDAAAALRGLAGLYGISGAAAKKRLVKIAAGLGSDVPFFMLDTALAAGKGRGEKLKTLSWTGRFPYIVLVYPGVPVYTKDVYARLKLGSQEAVRARLADLKKLLGLLKEGGFRGESAALLFNRLEEAVLPNYKEVKLAKERLFKFGADSALMSGSGSTVFALCRDRKKALGLAEAASSVSGYQVFLTKIC